MVNQRITVVFATDTVTVNKNSKRILLRQISGSNVKALHWYPASQSGAVVFVDTEDLPFFDPGVIKPYFDSWIAEPEQANAMKLGQHLNEITVTPDDQNIQELRAKWQAVKQPQVHAVTSQTLLQLLKIQQALSIEERTIRQNTKEQLLRALLNNQQKFEAARTEQREVKPTVYTIREAERRRLRDIALLKSKRRRES